MEFWQGPEDHDRAQEALYDAGITDGLPVVPPTRERVERMIAANGVDPDASVGVMMPACGNATWREIAINAVMAGARPEYLPVIGAAVEALCADEFNLLGVASTTGSAAPVIIVNGPIVEQIGMNAAGNALGPGKRSNATIGRTISLILRNIAGAVPGEMDMATLGQPAKYTCCFAENEAENPWGPLHVERGFERGASVVTTIGISGIVEIVDSSSSKPEDLAQTFAQSMLIAGNLGTGGLIGSGHPLLVIPPEMAQTFQRGGWTKADVQKAICERAVMPVDRISPAIAAHRFREEGGAIRELKLANDPKDILIVVAGGVGVKAAYFPTWPGTNVVSRAVRGQ